MSFTTSTSVICCYLYDWGTRLSFTYSSEKRQNLCLLQGDSEFYPQTLSRYGASLPVDLSYTSISTYLNASSLWTYNSPSYIGKNLPSCGCFHLIFNLLSPPLKMCAGHCTRGEGPWELTTQEQPPLQTSNVAFGQVDSCAHLYGQGHCVVAASKQRC